MKKPPRQVASSERRFQSRRLEDTRHPSTRKLEVFDLAAIKSELPAYLSRIGAKVFRETDRHIEAACPIHGGEHGNFHADLQPDGSWVWICRSQCGGLGGTLIDLHAALCGQRAGCRETIQDLAEVLGILPNTIHAVPQSSAGLQRQRRLEESRRSEQDMLSERLRAKRGDLLVPHASEDWRADFWHDSPLILEPSHLWQAKALIDGLFPQNAVLWLGDVKDSGRPENAKNFRTSHEWLSATDLPPRIAAGVFNPGSISRSENCLCACPYLVVESDELIGSKPRTEAEREENRALCAALLLFLSHRLKLCLRAVVDTGGKSLHGWFDRPSKKGMEALETVVEGLAIDPAVFARCASSPLRLPGSLHQSTGQLASLLYLNPTANNE